MLWSHGILSLRSLACRPPADFAAARRRLLASAAAAAAAQAAAAPRPPARRAASAAARGAFSAAARAVFAEKDLRLAATERELRERVAASERELRERVAAFERELRERVAASERELRERVAAFERELAGKDERLEDLRKAHAAALAVAAHDVDVSRGLLNVRGLFEACVEDAWRAAAPRVNPKERYATVSDKLRLLLRGDACPGLVAYLKVAAEDNGAPEGDLLRQAGRLYEVLSERLHSDAASGAGTTRLPAEVFERSGRTTMVALAAVVRFSGRDIALYDAAGDAQPLRLRLPPPAAAACAATFEALANTPFS